MSASPEKKSKVSSDSDGDDVDSAQLVEGWTTLSVVVEWGDSLSPVIRINGYPWRLRLHMVDNEHGHEKYELLLRCEKWTESELFHAEVSYRVKGYDRSHGTFLFLSFNKVSLERQILYEYFNIGTRLEVDIWPRDNGNEWRCRPILDIFAPRDGCLVIEDKKLYVNKESLASQSPYFDRLFNGEFKEKNMAEIPIGDVSAEEFTNLMRMVYGANNCSLVDGLLTVENVVRYLELADRFELEIVKDGVFNVLRSSAESSSSSFSIPESLLIADKHGLSCKDDIIFRYFKNALNEVCKAPEYEKLSMETRDDLFKRACELLD